MNRIKCRQCHTVFYLPGDNLPKGWTCAGCGSIDGEVFISFYVKKEDSLRAAAVLGRSGIIIQTFKGEINGKKT